MRFFPAKQARPRLSIIVIVYDMPRQAMNTLYSLSCAYQTQVNADDYEVVCVENASARNLEPSEVEALPGNFRYYRREESLPTPVFAVNFGCRAARAQHLCIMVDGARMVSPRLVHYTLKANHLFDNAVVAAPGYHLGDKLQQDAVASGYDETREMTLLDSIDWKAEGYRLFEISCLSGTSAPGFFKPIGESNTIGVSKALFERVGGFDTGFTETGGGQCNLDFYKRVLELEDTRLVMLFGEGSFHQYHGGVTTGAETGAERDAMMQRHFDQYRALRGGYYSPPLKDAVYLGDLTPAVMKFVHYSAQSVRRSRGELAEPDRDGEL